jgi:hypothetical protein
MQPYTKRHMNPQVHRNSLHSGWATHHAHRDVATALGQPPKLQLQLQGPQHHGGHTNSVGVVVGAMLTCPTVRVALQGKGKAGKDKDKDLLKGGKAGKGKDGKGKDGKLGKGGRLAVPVPATSKVGKPGAVPAHATHALFPACLWLRVVGSCL